MGRNRLGGTNKKKCARTALETALGVLAFMRRVATRNSLSDVRLRKRGEEKSDERGAFFTT